MIQQSLIGILQCGPRSQYAYTRQANSQCGNLGMSLSEGSRGHDSLHLKTLTINTHVHTTLRLPEPQPTLAASRIIERHLFTIVWKAHTPVMDTVWMKSSHKVPRVSLGLQSHACHQLLVHSPGHGRHEGSPQRTRNRSSKEPTQAMLLKSEREKNLNDANNLQIKVFNLCNLLHP